MFRVALPCMERFSSSAVQRFSGSLLLLSGLLTACIQPDPLSLPSVPSPVLTVVPSLIPTLPVSTAVATPTLSSPVPTPSAAMPGSPTLPPIVPTATADATATLAPTATLPSGDAVALEARPLPPYKHDTGLSDAARAHSCDMAANQFIGHESSDGRTLIERLPVIDPPWVWPSESVAAGVDDPAMVIALWMDEPPDGWHRRNLLDAEQTTVGVGYCFRDDDPSGNRHYWTMDITRH
jgi:uncharacterized protein YkwD